MSNEKDSSNKGVKKDPRKKGGRVVEEGEAPPPIAPREKKCETSTTQREQRCETSTVPTEKRSKAATVQREKDKAPPQTARKEKKDKAPTAPKEKKDKAATAPKETKASKKDGVSERSREADEGAEHPVESSRQVCTFFVKNRICKFRDSCLFEHPAYSSTNGRQKPHTAAGRAATGREKENRKHSSDRKEGRAAGPSETSVPPEIAQMLAKIQKKPNLFTVTEENKDLWRQTVEFIAQSPSMVQPIPSLLQRYLSLPENDLTVLPPAEVLTILARYISAGPASVNKFVLVGEIITNRLAHALSMKLVREKEVIVNQLDALRKAVFIATAEGDPDCEKSSDVLRGSISEYRQQVELHEIAFAGVGEKESLAELQVSNQSNGWINKPTVSWLMELPFWDAKDLQDRYVNLDEYTAAMRETWTLLTFYWGAAAFCPRCRHLDHSNKRCGNPVMHRKHFRNGAARSCPQEIIRGGKKMVCGQVAEWGCFRDGHETICHDCLRKKQIQACGSAGQYASTDIYDAVVHHSSVVGEGVVLHCQKLLSRHPPPSETPVNWRTTYRLQPAQLVAVVPLLTAKSPLKHDSTIMWGEIVPLSENNRKNQPNDRSNQNTEPNRRQRGEISVRLLNKQDSDLLDALGGALNDHRLSEGKHLAIVDLRVFAPEVVSVLSTLASPLFREGLESVTFKKLLLDSVSTPMKSIPDANMELRGMIHYGLSHSTIKVVRQLPENDLFQLWEEIWSIKEVKSLDITQGISFASSLMHSLHTCQGPPGSGKSYVGVCMVLAMAKIREFVMAKCNSKLGPIVVLAYKNHALDEFLLDVLRADDQFAKFPDKLIRLGKPEEPELMGHMERNSGQEREAQKRLTQRLEVLKGFKKIFKSISAAFLSDKIDPEVFLRCLLLLEADSDIAGSSEESWKFLKDFGSLDKDYLWETLGREAVGHLLRSSEHLLIDEQRGIQTLSRFNAVWQLWQSGSKIPHRCRGRIPLKKGNNSNAKQLPQNIDKQEETEVEWRQCLNCVAPNALFPMEYCHELHACCFFSSPSQGSCPRPRSNLKDALCCAEHTCKPPRGDCTRKKLSSNAGTSFCEVHSCSLCLQYKEELEFACEKHVCSAMLCKNAVFFTSDGVPLSFCVEHCCVACLQEGSVSLDSMCEEHLCPRHKCVIHGCIGACLPGKEHCARHLCLHCDEPVAANSVCDAHKCEEENCTRSKSLIIRAGEADPLRFCENHACLICAENFRDGQGRTVEEAISSRQTCVNHRLCEGLTAQGDQCDCLLENPDEEYCSEHANRVQTCCGITSKKTLCKSRPMKGSQFCKDHADQQKTRVPEMGNKKMKRNTPNALFALKSEIFKCFPIRERTCCAVDAASMSASAMTAEGAGSHVMRCRYEGGCSMFVCGSSADKLWFCPLHLKMMTMHQTEANTAVPFALPASISSLSDDHVTLSSVNASATSAPNKVVKTGTNNNSNQNREREKDTLASSDTANHDFELFEAEEDGRYGFVDALYTQGAGNPDEIDVFEDGFPHQESQESGKADDGEDDEDEEEEEDAAHLQHNREIYQAADDEIEEEEEDYSLEDGNLLSFTPEVHELLLSRWKDLCTFDWALSEDKRQSVLNRFLSLVSQLLKLIYRQAEKHVDEARRKKAEASGMVLKGATVIGGTIVGAAKRLPALRAAEPFAVIVEEACEVMEPTLISVLAVESLQKLELIGDHRQLPAFVNQCWYNLEFTRPKIKKSLFERIVLGIGSKTNYANHPICTVLDVQRRMRSSISALTKCEYEDIVQIQDHAWTAKQTIGSRVSSSIPRDVLTCWANEGRSVPGMQSNIFFWDLQDNAESKARVGLSACNHNEAQTVVQMVQFLHKVCLVPLSLITIITPYQGQRRVLVEFLRKEQLLPGFNKDNNKTNNNNNNYSGKVKSEKGRPSLVDKHDKPLLTVSTVDRYQGDENDIVILSLVKVQPGNRFVSLLNRFIVAASRARLGFFVVGSTSAVAKTDPRTGERSGAKHWLRFLDHLSLCVEDAEDAGTQAKEEQIKERMTDKRDGQLQALHVSLGHSDLDGFVDARVGGGLPICCPCHRSASRWSVPSKENKRVFPTRDTWSAFCSAVCNASLRCGHKCTLTCHAFAPGQHEQDCGEILRRPCERHKDVPLRCGEVAKRMSPSDKSSLDVLTNDERWQCEVKTTTRHPFCVHSVSLPCCELKKCERGLSPWPKCQQIVQDHLLPCGHSIAKPKCFEVQELLKGKRHICTEKVIVPKECGTHSVVVECHQQERERAVPCREQVHCRRPRCRHPISLYCVTQKEMEALWREGAFLSAEVNAAGKSELNEGTVYGPSEAELPLAMKTRGMSEQCRQRILLRRKCGHIIDMSCEEGFRSAANPNNLPPCAKPVLLPCPLCGEPHVRVECAQLSRWQSVNEEISRRLGSVRGDFDCFVSLLRKSLSQTQIQTERDWLTLVANENCPTRLEFTHACQHTLTERGTDLLRALMHNKPLPPCVHPVGIKRDCGHTLTTPCHLHDKPLPPCKEKAFGPFIFPDCKHTIDVKTCAALQKKKAEYKEGKLFCTNTESLLTLPRCGHNVTLACGRKKTAQQLICEGERLREGEVVFEMKEYCVPCFDAPRCEAMVRFARQCGHEEEGVRCCDAFSWTRNTQRDSITDGTNARAVKAHMPLCRREAQAMNPLCGHVVNTSCFLAASLTQWRPWGPLAPEKIDILLGRRFEAGQIEERGEEEKVEDNLGYFVKEAMDVGADAMANLHEAHSNVSFAHVSFPLPPKAREIAPFPHRDRSDMKLYAEERKALLLCREEVCVSFPRCGHTQFFSCGEFYATALGLINAEDKNTLPRLRCSFLVARQCSFGHTREVRCDEEEHVDKLCNFRVKTVCARCKVNFVHRECKDNGREALCEQEVTLKLSCGHTLRWQCGKEKDPRESFVASQNVYLDCTDCIVNLWEREVDFTFSAAEMRAFSIAELKSELSLNEDNLEATFLSAPVAVEIGAMMEQYDRARLASIRRLEEAHEKGFLRDREVVLPPNWDKTEEVRRERYLRDNYELVFLPCGLDKKPNPGEIHQRRFKLEDGEFGRALSVTRATREALLSLARSGEVKLCLALAFRTNALMDPEPFVDSNDSNNKEEAQGKRLANKKASEIQSQGFDYCVFHTPTAAQKAAKQHTIIADKAPDATLLFWDAKAVVPLQIVHLKLHVDCVICMESNPNDRKYGAICPRGHFVCWEYCFEHYIGAANKPDAISGYLDESGRLVCPDIKCKAEGVAFDQHLLCATSSSEIFDAVVALQFMHQKNRAVRVALEEEQRKWKEEMERVRKMDERDREAFFVRKKIIEDILTKQCPRCKMVYDDFDGCFALTCGNKQCAAGFCAWCETDCGTDAHAHVAHCKYNVTRNVYGDLRELEAVHRRIRTDKIKELLRPLQPEVRALVIERTQGEFRNCGLDIR